MARPRAVSIAVALALLLGLHCPMPFAAAAAAKCPSAKESKKATAIKCKYLILGAGAAGLTAAYSLKHHGKDVCVVDANTWWGGRVHDDPGPDRGNETIVLGSCGLRILAAQLLPRCMCRELNVSLQSSRSDTGFLMRGQMRKSDNWFMNASYGQVILTDMPVPGNGSTPTDLIQAMYDFLWNMSKVNGGLIQQIVNPLTGELVDPPARQCALSPNLMYYIQNALSDEAADLLAVDWWERHPFQNPVDVCNIIDNIQTQLKPLNSLTFYPVGGFSAMLYGMQAAAAKAGVRFWGGTNITCLTSSSSKGTITYKAYASGNATSWSAQKLLGASPPGQMQYIDGGLADQLNNARAMQQIEVVESVVLNVYYPERWWSSWHNITYASFRIFNDYDCLVRMEFLGNPYVAKENGTRVMYTDSEPCVLMYKAVYANGEKEVPGSGIDRVYDIVLQQMQRVFANVTIPRPTALRFYNQPNSWHLSKAYSVLDYNMTTSNIAAWAAQPLGNQQICMIGEAYNLAWGGWVYGAMDSARRCLNQRFAADLDPAAQAAEQQCEAAAQKSVDGTGPYFPNEQILDSEPYGQWPGMAARTVEDCGAGCCPLTDGL